MQIDVIIVLYKPGRELFTLLEKLQAQRTPVHKVILMNTEEKYFRPLVYGTDFYDRFQNFVEVYHLSKREFDHGRTRRAAVKKSTADVFVMMTQDAIPVDDLLIEKLTQALTDQTAVAYARQLPKPDCQVAEQIVRAFNYPPQSRQKSAADEETLGIKTYFCSNVCAAYRREIYEELGGFVRHAIFNEDMIYAGTAIQAGYAIAYEAEAQVLHSHNYTVKQQFRRNFDLGVSQAQHPEIFGRLRSVTEGKKMVGMTLRTMWQQRKRKQIPYFCLQCAGKYMGYLLGKHYKCLPRKVVLKCTGNQTFWDA